MCLFSRKRFVLISTFFGLMLAVDGFATSRPAELSVDYAAYNPLSMVIRRFNWLANEFKDDHVQIRWVHSNSSMLAMNHLNSAGLDIASGGIVSAALSKAGGNRVKALYVFARSELNAILVSRDSPITSMMGLKGKRISTPLGTPAHFALLQNLREIGLHKDDVVIVPLEHKEGRIALERNEVDAWSTTQPYGSLSQLETGSRLLNRNSRFNTYFSLIAKEDFARKYPDVVTRVIKVYERARKWAITHPDDLEKIYADEEKVSLQVARLTLSKFDFFNPVVDRNDIAMLMEATDILKEERLITSDTDLDNLANELIDRSFVVKEISKDLNRK
jgi:sulfonate transport system substrate-binding protein